MKYSFIIPVKKINEYIHESVSKILEIDRDDYEIIIYPDEVSNDIWKKTRQIASGSGGPAMKRNLATRDAIAEILIFIDDDAYPEKNFLEILDKDFENLKISAVGGPAITPKDDTFWQKVSGVVFVSHLSGGNPNRYVSIGKKHEILDWPSVNLSVRKKQFDQIGGFNSDYWPGEDTKFCLDLTRKTKGKIIYNPKLIVWHHRREGLFYHLKQIAGYGLHRGFFAKKHPETSFTFKYFVPSFFLLFLFFGAILSIISSFFLKLYLIGWLLYVLAILKAFFDIYKFEKNIFIILNSLYYIFFTHIIYGFKFIQGFILTSKLKSKYR